MFHASRSRKLKINYQVVDQTDFVGRTKLYIDYLHTITMQYITLFQPKNNELEETVTERHNALTKLVKTQIKHSRTLTLYRIGQYTPRQLYGPFLPMTSWKDCVANCVLPPNNPPYLNCNRSKLAFTTNCQS